MTFPFPSPQTVFSFSREFSSFKSQLVFFHPLFLKSMSDQGKVPSDLVLAASVPLGIRAYRRRFISPVSSGQTLKPGGFASIYPDTSTPGAFIDPESTYLAFDITFKNSHFCVDYTDFGVEGVGGAVISEWRVNNQGTTLEEILNYPIAAAAMCTLEGSFEQEVRLYFSAVMKNGAQDEYHRNFIKPPMVDRSKNIMFGPNPFGLGILKSSATTEYWQGTVTAATNGQIAGFVCGGLGSAAASETAAAVMVGSVPPYFPTAIAKSVQTPAATGDSSAVTPATFPENFSPDQVDVVQQYLFEYGSINKPQVMANLCNVKCFPIGLKHRTKALTLQTTANLVANASNPVYRICYRPLSGIFGKMATKMVASTLIAPQQLSIQMRFSEAHTVFQVSADPCRRQNGTCRDFVRNRGIRGGQAYNTAVAWTTAANSHPYNTVTSTMAVGYTAHYNINDTAVAANENTIFNAEAASGRYRVNQQLDVAQGGVALDTSLTVALALVANSNAIGTVGVGANLPPAPQYALASSPWTIGVNGYANTVNYVAEDKVFYGTYLPASVPQASRIFRIGVDGTTSASLTLNNYAITYEIDNMALIGDQLILPNETTADIINAAEAGGYNVVTNSIRTYEMPITNGATQTIVCPFKVNMAKKILFVFQNNVVRESIAGYLYDSNAGINPFCLVESAEANAMGPNPPLVTSVDGTATGVGFANALTYTGITTTNPASLSVQLRIGNDFFPQAPLTNMQEIVAELTKTMEGWHTSSYSAPIMGSVVTNTAGKTIFNSLEDRTYTTAFTHHNLLDDQTITGNPDFIPLLSTTLANADAAGGQHHDSTTYALYPAVYGVGKMAPRGYCLQGVFKPLSSTFVLGFNLRSFKSSDGVDGGAYLGNSNISLLMNGCHGLNGKDQTYRLIGIIPHRAMLRYGAGGQMVWAY